MTVFLYVLIKIQKAILRVRLGWIAFLRWGARNRLREIETAMWYAREDQWWEARKKWRASLAKRYQQGVEPSPQDEP